MTKRAHVFVEQGAKYMTTHHTVHVNHPVKTLLSQTELFINTKLERTLSIRPKPPDACLRCGVVNRREHHKHNQDAWRVTTKSRYVHAPRFNASGHLSLRMVNQPVQEMLYVLILTSISQVSNIEVHRESHGVERVGQDEGPYRLTHQQRQQQQLRTEQVNVFMQYRKEEEGREQDM